MNLQILFVATVLGAFSCNSAMAQVTIGQPWVRATVPQQMSTGAFMEIRSAKDMRLVQAHSSVAEIVELHEMSMEGDVMKMRAVNGIELPAGKSVDLKPGGYHVMLMGLKSQLRAGSTVPLTFVLEGKDGHRETVEIRATVRPLRSAPAKASSDAKH